MEVRSAKPWEQNNRPQQRTNQHAGGAVNKKKPVVEAHGVIGAVPTADRVVIYLNEAQKEGSTKWVAPKKVEVKLSWVKAPKAHFLFIDEETGDENEQLQDDFFWEAREHLRKFAIGKTAKIEVRPNEEKLGYREIGTVQIKDGNKTVDLSQYIVSSGYADVQLPKNYLQGAEGTDNAGGKGGQDSRRTPKPNESITKLVDLEREAKSQNLGKFQTSKVNAQLEPLLDFNHKNKYAEWRGTEEKQKLRHKCVVEAVMSGSMVKVTILPSMEQIALRIAGVRSPVYVRPNQPKPRDGGKEQVSEPFGAEAQWTTERYTLHRDAEIIFTGFDPDKDNHKDKHEPERSVYYGELFIKEHSIGEILLTSGLASFVEWSAPKDKAEKYRQLEEKSASTKQKIWSQPGKVSNTTQLTQADQSNNSAASQGDKGKQPEAPTKSSRSFNGRVKSVTNGALFVIEDLDTPNHQAKTVTLSSIVVPKFGRSDRGRHEGDEEETSDEPFCWEAREFIRKKILGKNVKVTLDYIRPELASKDPKKKGQKAVPAKAYHTVEFEGKNVGLGLVENGFATVLPGAGDNRSPIYESLQMAQERAKKNGLGLHAKKNASRKGYNDVTSNKKTSKGLLPTLTGKTVEGVVEYVISGNRFKVSVPRDQLIIIVVLDGVKTPALPRKIKELKDGEEVEKEVPGEPFAHEALEFSRNLCHQADVSVTIDRQDKAGSFIGYLFKGKQNVAELILAEGLGRGIRSKQHESQFASALQQAKEKRKGIWKDWDPVKEEEEKRKAAAESDDSESSGVKDESIKVIVHVTEIIDSNKFYCQFIDEGKEVEQLNKYMAAFAGMNLSAAKEHEPTRNEVVLAQFSGDGNWYRAQIRNITGKNISVFYGDFGNSETTTSEYIRKLPEEYGLKSLRFQARECGLAYIKAVTPALDADLAEDAAYELKRLIYDQKLPATREYSRPETMQSRNRLIYLNLWANDEQNTYINGELVRRGLAKVDRRLPRNAPETAVRLLRDMEDSAHDNKTGLWVSGDPGEEDENERN